MSKLQQNLLSIKLEQSRLKELDSEEAKEIKGGFSTILGGSQDDDASLSGPTMVTMNTNTTPQVQPKKEFV